MPTLLLTKQSTGDIVIKYFISRFGGKSHVSCLISETTMPRISRRHGFTLIELLVVISIIGLLISILLPALGAARHTARLSQDLSQQRQLMIGTAAYQVDYDGFFPLSARLNNTFNVSFDELLIPYVQGVSYSFDDAWNDQYITRNEINMEIW
ncbi:MAG: type II secretion system protein, partial [Pseudomonadota bacterium]